MGVGLRGRPGTAELLETRRAFDSVAPTYDRSNTENAVLSAMRARVMALVREHASPGSTLLDLGCGPGADAVSLARAGYRIVAVDWAPEMVREAQARITREGLGRVVEVRHLGIHEIDRLEGPVFEAAYSNFGPLNCVPDLDRAARAIYGRLRPGGALIASVIGRICPWELAVYVLRGDLRRAAVRFARHFVPVPLNGRTVWTRYYSPREFADALEGAGFRQRALRALGLMAPPPYLCAAAARHPRLIGGLLRLDDRVAGWPGLRQWGDHFLMVLERL